MLDEADAVVLAPGVIAGSGRLADSVRGTSWPTNTTAEWMLERMGRPLGEVAAELSSRYRVPNARARSDVLAFAWQLNAAMLANVVQGRPTRRRVLSWIALAIRLAPAGVLPRGAARRLSLDTSTATAAVRTTASGLRRRFAVLSGCAAVFALHLTAVAGDPSPIGSGMTGLALGSAVVIHESSHVVALRGVRAALVTQGLRTFVLHAPVDVRRRRLVAVAGPVGAAVLGLVLLHLAWALGSTELAIAALPPSAHALGLTTLTSDGRTTCDL